MIELWTTDITRYKRDIGKSLWAVSHSESLALISYSVQSNYLNIFYFIVWFNFEPNIKIHMFYSFQILGVNMHFSEYGMCVLLVF